MYRTGASRTRLYGIWNCMKFRCASPKHNRYKNYGGRGISVCPEWINDFFAFATWSLMNGYKVGLVIDRVNNNGNYSPDNCRWVTQAQNMLNQSRNHLETYLGITKTLKEWSEDPICVVDYNVLQLRVSRGMPFSYALTTTKELAVIERGSRISAAKSGQDIIYG